MAKLEEYQIEELIRKQIKEFASSIGLYYVQSTNECCGTIEKCYIPKDKVLYDNKDIIINDIGLLLDYLKLEIESDRRIVKVNNKD